MESKLTNSQIARVFAMYWNCKVSFLDSKTEIHSIAHVIWTCHEDEDYRFVNEYKLLLTPLQAISDEDAVEVAEMYGGVRLKIDGDGFIQVIDSDGYVPKWFSSSMDLPSMLFQYLIQKRYAVPLFIEVGHPDNGKDAIQLGLAIDKTKEVVNG